MDAVVLAGGFGTRLKDVVSDVPKPLAPVAGRPFLDYVLQYLKVQGVTRVVLAVGYKWEMIGERYSRTENTFGLDIELSIETEPLGTGGAVFEAAKKVSSNSFFIVNGDTYFNVPLNSLYNFFRDKEADIALTLKQISPAIRYGTVERTPDDRIVSFIEKGANTKNESVINGGVYLMRKKVIEQFDLPSRFSFEKDLLQDKLNDIKAFGKLFEGTFIDIGIPEDYRFAQDLFKNFAI
jgi:D-glycero-alpha-D-manno-heptose 1-phosphate guanylyltransferase